MKCGVIALVFALAGASAVRADVATNCFRLVTYQPGSLYHLEADVGSYGKFEFALDFYDDTGWRVIDHGSNSDVCFEKTSRHHLISYLDFMSGNSSVSFGGATNLYCAFTWNARGVKHTTADNLGWFHLRMADGLLEIVSSGAERQEGYRLEVEPDGWPLLVAGGSSEEESAEVGSWLDPATGICWRYKDYGAYCGIGTGNEGESAIAAGSVQYELVLPDAIVGLPVRRIESWAFRGVDVASVSLPTSVIEIAMWAFAGSSAKEIMVASGNPAFRGLDGLVVSADGTTLVVVPPGLDIEAIPNGLAVIGTGALAGCRCVNSDLVIPKDVREIRANAFMDAAISCLTFEGDAPTLASNAFTSGRSYFEICYRIGTKGWPCAFELQGHETEVLDDKTVDDSETERERVDSDGSVWRDKVCGWRSVEKTGKRTSSQWTRSDRESWQTNVTTRQISPVESSDRALAYGWRDVEVDYWDLEHVRERRERGGWTDYTEDSKGGFFDEKMWTYDEQGRLVCYENAEQYYYDAVDETRLAEVEEKRTLDYSTEGDVREETVRKAYYLDGTMMTEERRIVLKDEPDRRYWSRDENVNVIFRDGGVRREERFEERKYAYEGELVYAEWFERVTESGFCREANEGVEYGKNGEVKSRSADASLAPAEYVRSPVRLLPGDSCEVEAKDEAEALAQVSVACSLPKDVEDVVAVSIKDYFDYFKRSVVRVGEDRWRVTFEISPEAISLPKTFGDLAGRLAEIADGTAKEVTLTCMPGLWYGLGYSEDLTGPYRCDLHALAEGDTVTLPVPSAKPKLFLRLFVRTEAPQ